ncbi:Hypothetical_protein [Hexamita inflata]|uniref:Hypothetical_protein n=1 Tax=Hexamita inflata TaxID=28002 RepID=A0AA86RA88_9EUKA|nr:Hypothetical protein HINF_LOCUS62374 [Hexamita inflata]
MYTQRTQDLQLNLTYSMQSLQSFALFGITTNIQVQSSNISVKVPQDLANGSLLCFSCDVNAFSSDFTFIASGQNITGVVQAPLTILMINQSLVQFRLNGVNIGGLILNASEIQVSIVDCNISGFVIDGNVSGSIIAFVNQQVDFGVENVKICSNVPYFGHGALSQQGIVDTCVICKDGFYTYGLCLASLQFSELINDQLVCINSFTFDGEKCSCAEGQILNGTTCLNVLNSINSLSSQQIQVQNQVADLTNRTTALENVSRELTGNLSHTNLLIQNLQQDQIVSSAITDQNIISNITSLNQTLLNNVASLNALIQNLQAQIDLLQNKQDKLPLEMLNNMFQQENYEATELWIICGQPAFIQTFDITSVTNTIISSNFTNGSVFGSKINVQNVFIDIQGGVYGSVVQPLFAAQNQFYNIKVQIGNQIVGSGQILSSNNSIIINQMIILSKLGTTLTINSLLTLSILQTQSVSTTIKDVKIQFNIQASTGNLGLVRSLIGQMNIINYEVSGTYEMQGMMSLGVQTLSSSKVLIKHVNFAPFSYIYGNQSSYLFGIITSSSIEIAKSTITIGNQSTVHFGFANYNKYIILVIRRLSFLNDNDKACCGRIILNLKLYVFNLIYGEIWNYIRYINVFFKLGYIQRNMYPVYYYCKYQFQLIWYYWIFGWKYNNIISFYSFKYQCYYYQLFRRYWKYQQFKQAVELFRFIYIVTNIIYFRRNKFCFNRIIIFNIFYICLDQIKQQLLQWNRYIWWFHSVIQQ